MKGVRERCTWKGNYFFLCCPILYFQVCFLGYIKVKIRLLQNIYSIFNINNYQHCNIFIVIILNLLHFIINFLMILVLNTLAEVIINTDTTHFSTWALSDESRFSGLSVLSRLDGGFIIYLAFWNIFRKVPGVLQKQKANISLVRSYDELHLMTKLNQLMDVQNTPKK